jgi:transcriptional regulator with XRE-family HTH domain
MKIRKLREAQEMTQAELAKRARVAQSHISMLEPDERKRPSIQLARSWRAPSACR